LPDGNGLDLATKIRSTGPNECTPIVMISSNASINDAQIRNAHSIDAQYDKSLSIGAPAKHLESYLPKPKVASPKELLI